VSNFFGVRHIHNASHFKPCDPIAICSTHKIVSGWRKRQGVVTKAVSLSLDVREHFIRWRLLKNKGN
jgi:hypothetical protein